jgi:hypothetical protein
MFDFMCSGEDGLSGEEAPLLQLLMLVRIGSDATVAVPVLDLVAAAGPTSPAFKTWAFV